MKALQTIQQKLKANKSQYNSFGKYNYRNLEDILESVKPLLAETDSTLIITEDLVLVGSHTYIKATASLIDGTTTHSSTAFARHAEEQKGMNDSQLTGATSSYARKYALGGLFLIDDSKDADATNTHGKDKPEVKTDEKNPVSGKPTTPQNTPKTKLIALTPTHKNWSAVVDKLRNKDVTMEAIKQFYSLTPEHQAILIEESSKPKA